MTEEEQGEEAEEEKEEEEEGEKEVIFIPHVILPGSPNTYLSCWTVQMQVTSHSAVLSGRAPPNMVTICASIFLGCKPAKIVPSVRVGQIPPRPRFA